MTSAADFAPQLSELLDLAHPPVAVTLDAEPATGGTEPIPAQPAGGCFWARAEHRSFDTQPSDHANSSIRSYIHGLIDLNDAEAGTDTAALGRQLLGRRGGPPRLGGSARSRSPDSNRDSAKRARQRRGMGQPAAGAALGQRGEVGLVAAPEQRDTCLLQRLGPGFLFQHPEEFGHVVLDFLR
jgi:hypothetical protein